MALADDCPETSSFMNKPLRIGILAGEKSGDNLGADLIRAIRRLHPDCQFEGIAGVAMQAQGCISLYPMERLSVMGFVEPLSRLPELLRIKKGLLQHFSDQPPDVFIGIDSPGFNLRVEKELRARGIKTVHYVSPSVWAYGARRIHKIKRAVDLMLALFPFETAIYKQHGVAVECTGHPLADSIDFSDRGPAARLKLGFEPQDTVIALLPGSRANEISRLGPVFLQTAKHCLQSQPRLKFVIPCAGPESLKQIQHLVKEENCQSAVTLLDGDAHTAISAADVVLLASGTATLETMLLKRPMIICYKLAPLTYALISRMLKVPYMGLPNLLAGRQLVPEFRQHDVSVANLSAALEKLLHVDGNRQELLESFNTIHRQLRTNASVKAATAILRLCGVVNGAA